LESQPDLNAALRLTGDRGVDFRRAHRGSHGVE
jgi:hypothetical protein